MISFIVIGRNEGSKLNQCFQSIYDTVSYNSLNHYEIIYVDSNSEDDSIERAKGFDKIKVFKLTNDYNSAIARNLGAKKSNGSILFFVDGDMELLPEFLPLVYSESKGLIYPFVSGQLNNFNYTRSGQLLNHTLSYSKVLSADKYNNTTGGIFLIYKKLWNDIKGMDVRFKKGQDLDFGYRFAKKRIYLLRKKEIIANHHTVPYKDKSRIWKDLNNQLYTRSFLYRKHFLNPKIYSRLLRNEYSLIVMIISLIAGIAFGVYYLFILYLIVILIRSKLHKSIDLSLIGFLISRDLIVLGGFLFFLPKKRFDIKYIML